MTVRFRSELTLSATKSYPVGTTAIVAAASVTVPNTRVGIFRAYLSGNSTTAATFQFQDTSNNALSAVYSLPANGFFAFETPINLDPLWQSVGNQGSGVGVQLVVTGATITADIWTMITP
jgi:hypothetical protein